METTSLELCHNGATFSFTSPDRGDVAELPNEAVLPWLGPYEVVSIPLSAEVP